MKKLNAHFTPLTLHLNSPKAHYITGNFFAMKSIAEGVRACLLGV
jgi:hypothetical protein